MKSVILGIGNTLLRDEGVGIHVLETLKSEFFKRQQTASDVLQGNVKGNLGKTDLIEDQAVVKLPHGDTIHFVDGGTLSFTLAGIVERADNLIVIDAAQLGKPPGSVDCLVDDKMDHFLGSCKRGVHEIGLLDLLDIARLTDNLPEHRALVGIQPEVIDWGDTLTKSVQAGLPTAINAVHELLEQWHEARYFRYTGDRSLSKDTKKDAKKETENAMTDTAAS